MSESSCSGPPIQPREADSSWLGVSFATRPKVLPMLLSTERLLPLATMAVRASSGMEIDFRSKPRVEHRLREAVQDAARVVRVVLALHDLGSDDGVELSEIEAEHAFHTARPPRSVGLFHDLEWGAGVGSGGDGSGWAVAQAHLPTDRIGLDACVEPNPRESKSVRGCVAARGRGVRLGFGKPQFTP